MPQNFRIPGPTPLPPSVTAAMQRPMIPHRGQEFKDLYRSIMTRLREVHRTEGDVFVWPGSGSAGWEIAIVNMLAPGDEVVAVICGEFGERFAAAAVALGIKVHRLDIPWGMAAKPDDVRAALQRYPSAKAVFLTHNETSTGVTNPLADLAAVVREQGALVIVDAVSSASGIPLETDAWGLDFVLSGSQKAWMCPPGMVIAAVGPRAWEATARSGYPRFFWDLYTVKKAADAGMAVTTPPLTALYALDAALDLLLEEGLEHVWARHAMLGQQTRDGLRELGLRLVAEAGYESNTVTGFFPPEGLDTKSIINALADKHDVIVTGGQGKQADSIIRIGHMGWCTPSDIDEVLSALESVLAESRGKSDSSAN